MLVIFQGEVKEQKMFETQFILFSVRTKVINWLEMACNLLDSFII